MKETIVIARRFSGPPDSANGGYACGVIGARMGGAEVTLRRPPPLERPMELERDGGEAWLLADGALVAEARRAAPSVEAPAPPSFDEATRAAERFPWREDHQLPTCFVCGPARAYGDGLRIHPGAVDGRALAASPFVPDASLADDDGLVREEIVWSALDCPSWFGFQCFERGVGLALLGRMTAQVTARPREGERCVVVGWSLGRDGRKVRGASALYGEDGAPLAVAEATWIILR